MQISSKMALCINRHGILIITLCKHCHCSFIECIRRASDQHSLGSYADLAFSQLSCFYMIEQAHGSLSV